uniref:uncharacterized protein LOC105352044 n=1 Tax=Fragaria vesca subsp. vesca TaxID=101020 RepID=UPI0005C81A41|nr:PREDICTED: uncharacterized protein LOC105352044 [Fragaria vesca subsp. vesca]
MSNDDIPPPKSSGDNPPPPKSGGDPPPPKPNSSGSDADPFKAEPSNPYFIHHSDHPGLVLVSKLLNGDNFSGWKRAMVRALNSKNKLGFVNGSIKAPSEETDPEGYAIWSRCNDMVHSWIVNSCDPEIADSVTYYPNAHEVWEDLHERFSQENATRIFEIQREIASHRQEQLPVSTYYTKLKSFWDELATYSDTAHGAQADQQRLMQFLMGLNETYSAIRGQILLMNPLPTVRQAYAAISQEEKQRLLSVSHTTSELDSSAAMAVRNSNRPNSNSARGGRFERSDRPGQHRPEGRFSFASQEVRRSMGRGRGRPQCVNCGDMGHWVQTCYQLIGYPPGHPKAKQNSTANSSNFPSAPSANQVSEVKSEEEPVISLS